MNRREAIRRAAATLAVAATGDMLPVRAVAEAVSPALVPVSAGAACCDCEADSAVYDLTMVPDFTLKFALKWDGTRWQGSLPDDHTVHVYSSPSCP